MKIELKTSNIDLTVDLNQDELLDFISLIENKSSTTSRPKFNLSDNTIRHLHALAYDFKVFNYSSLTHIRHEFEFIYKLIKQDLNLD